MVKNLKELFCSPQQYHIKEDVEINEIHFDSRKLGVGDLFVACRGTNSDGHDYIEEAEQKGVKAIVCEELPKTINSEITYVCVKDSLLALSELAHHYYGKASHSIQLIGVTGTNGKTSVATLLYQLFRKMGHKVGLLSTIKNYIHEKEVPATHTTPNALQLNKLLHEMLLEGCQYCFMEVSSHAIDQKRTAWLKFKAGIFTNITHEHLDYHKTFAAYLAVKKSFFDQLGKNAFAISNADDKNGKIMLQNTRAQKIFYSTKSFANFHCKILEKHFSGMLLEINALQTWVKFIGDFNAYNLLAVYATACLLNQEKNETLRIISELNPVKGRFESMISPNGIIGIVDYAHTPDALKNVLETIENLRTRNEQLIVVVGCGGNRDKTKRPLMAQIAAQMSNKLILTSDNPRFENPDEIISDMKKGINPLHLKKVLTISNRKEAIKTACMLAKQNDMILVAGKGHETYQEINGVKHHFDDKEIIQTIFKQN